ncbi:MAG: insulinase family protein, partial [Lachnospiraceae bacterium]|nr:insulinase family protein [Lachnospiraceae bacterium]
RAVNAAVSGLALYDLVADLEKNYDKRKEGLKAKLRELCELIFCKNNLFISVTSDGEGIAKLRAPLAEFMRNLPDQPVKTAPAEKMRIVPVKKNEGFTTPGQVQYVARAGNFEKAGFAYTGALQILKVLMSYEYLWVNLRVKGGAYGCMCSFSRRGDSYFASYRDPHLRGTNEIYDGIPAFLESFDADEREMTKYIIGAISELDTPLTPAGKGSRSLNAYFSQISEEQVQRERDEILTANPEQIRALAPLVRAILDENAFCVVGNEEKIREAEDLFFSVRALSGANEQ